MVASAHPALSKILHCKFFVQLPLLVSGECLDSGAEVVLPRSSLVRPPTPLSCGRFLAAILGAVTLDVAVEAQVPVPVELSIGLIENGS